MRSPSSLEIRAARRSARLPLRPLASLPNTYAPKWARDFDERSEPEARRRRVRIIKDRARLYLRQPWQLETLERGLSEAMPAEGLAILARSKQERPLAGLIICGAELAFRYCRRAEATGRRLLAAE